MRISLSPMLGITDAVFRNAFASSFGHLDSAIAPFFKVNQYGEFKLSKLYELDPCDNQNLPCTPQIMANSAKNIVATFNVLQHKYGYDHINLNLGCPSPTSAGRGMGCGLMPHPDAIDEILEHVHKSISGTISIKTRLGLHDTDEIETLMKVFNRYPLKELVIHPRTGVQRYSGAVDIESFEKVYNQSEIPISYSGDINYAADFQTILLRFPRLHTCYIGRGVLRNPALPQEIRHSFLAENEVYEFEDGSTKYLNYMKDMAYNYQERNLGEKQILTKLKTIWYYRADYKNIDLKKIKQTKKSKTFRDFFETMDNALEDNDSK